jgi:hypothetical protein
MSEINSSTDVDDADVVDRSREAFETFYMTLTESEKLHLYRTTKPFRGVPVGEYKWVVTRSMYVGWQAAELRSTKAQAPLSAKAMSDWLIADLRKEYIGQSIENWLPAAVEAMLKELKASKDIQALSKIISDLTDENDALVAELDDLIAQSDGVSGLHLNGTLADWEWLKSNGWLAVYEQYIEKTK